MGKQPAYRAMQEKVGGGSPKLVRRYGKVDVLQMKLADLSVKLAGLFAKLAGLFAKLAGLSAKLVDLSVKLADLSVKLADLSVKLADLSAKLAGLSAKLVDLSAKLVDLSAKLVDLSAKLAIPGCRRLALGEIFSEEIATGRGRGHFSGADPKNVLQFRFSRIHRQKSRFFDMSTIGVGAKCACKKTNK